MPVQRLTEHIALVDLEGIETFVEDTLVHTEDLEKQLEVLEAMLTRLREVDMPAQPSKDTVSQKKIDFLGYTWSAARG